MGSWWNSREDGSNNLHSGCFFIWHNPRNFKYSPKFAVESPTFENLGMLCFQAFRVLYDTTSEPGFQPFASIKSFLPDLLNIMPYCNFFSFQQDLNADTSNTSTNASGKASSFPVHLCIDTSQQNDNLDRRWKWNLFFWLLFSAWQLQLLVSPKFGVKSPSFSNF